MPELPEVETMRRGVAAVAGRTIAAVVVPKNRCQPITMTPQLAAFKKAAVGRRIDAVERVGKRVLFRLDSGSILVIEPRMTGLVFLDNPPNSSHLRLIVELKGPGSPDQFLFWDQRGLGVVRLVTPEQYGAHYGSHRVGPDAMVIAVEELAQRLSRSSRAIKVALLDQSVLAGVGNLYASEILHRAAIHPVRRCSSLTKSDWSAVHASMLAVLGDAIEHQGSTLRDGTYRIARDELGSYQFNHRVYQRDGEKCLTCGQATITRIVQAQRSTFFCSLCQKPSLSRRGTKPASRAVKRNDKG